MLEFQCVPADVVGCFARPDALDALGGNGEPSVRVAPDELLVLGRRAHCAALETELVACDEHAFAIDLSGGFAVYALRGDDRHEAIARLSALDLPKAPAVAQGLVAHVPAKLIVGDDEILVIVSSAVAHHVRERVFRACADLGPSEARRAEQLVAKGAPE